MGEARLPSSWREVADVRASRIADDSRDFLARSKTPACFSGAERETQKGTYKVPYHNVVPLHLGLLAGQLLALELQPGKTKSHVRLGKLARTPGHDGGRGRGRGGKNRRGIVAREEKRDVRARGSARCQASAWKNGGKARAASIGNRGASRDARRGKCGGKRRTQAGGGGPS